MSDKKKYHYFVSYIFMKGDFTGYGSCDTTRDAPIRNGKDIAAIQAYYQKHLKLDKVTILNFREFDSE